MLLTGISLEAFNQLFTFLTKYFGISPVGGSRDIAGQETESSEKTLGPQPEASLCGHQLRLRQTKALKANQSYQGCDSGPLGAPVEPKEGYSIGFSDTSPLCQPR